MSEKSGGFLKPWKDGTLENLCKWTGGIWWAMFIIAAFGWLSPTIPDQYFSSAYWGRVTHERVTTIFGARQ
jgi:hypothetical protein